MAARSDFRRTGMRARSAATRRSPRSTSPSWRARAGLSPCNSPSRLRSLSKRSSSIFAIFRPGSREPALAALVRLDLLERASVLARGAQIEFAHVLVVLERFGRAVEHDAASLQNVAEARAPQSSARVLLGEQEGDAFALVEAAHDLEDLIHDLRRKPHRGLVEQDELRPRHHRPPDRAHLLLASRR